MTAETVQEPQDMVKIVYFVTDIATDERLTIGAFVDGEGGRRFVPARRHIPLSLLGPKKSHLLEMLLGALPNVKHDEDARQKLGLHVSVSEPRFFPSSWGVSKKDSTWLKDHLLPKQETPSIEMKLTGIEGESLAKWLATRLECLPPEKYGTRFTLRTTFTGIGEAHEATDAKGGDPFDFTDVDSW